MDDELTEHDLFERYPAVEWQRPIAVDVWGLPRKLVCRLCLALPAVDGDRVRQSGFDTLAEFNRHVAEHHEVGPIGEDVTP